MISRAPWEGVASRSRPTSSAAARTCAAVSRSAGTRRVLDRTLELAAMAAEVLALRPVLFDRDAPIAGLDVVFSLVGGSFAACGLDRLAPAARQPQRPADDRDRLRVLHLAAAGPARRRRSRHALGAARRHVDLLFVALLLTLLTRGRLQPRARPLARRRLRGAARASLQVAWMLFAELDGRQPAARVPGRGRRARDRPGAARDCSPAAARRPSR